MDSAKFNTAIAGMMKFVGGGGLLSGGIKKQKETIETFLKLLAPFAPHLTEELWRNILKNKNSIHIEQWPPFDESKIILKERTIAIQIDGKVRDTLAVSVNMADEEVKGLALLRENIVRWTKGKKIKKVMYISGRIVNIVTEKNGIESKSS